MYGLWDVDAGQVHTAKQRDAGNNAKERELTGQHLYDVKGDNNEAQSIYYPKMA